MTRYMYQGRTEQRKAAIKRKADARALYEKGEQHFMGAMYLAGYAIECNLKAIAMQIYGVNTLKDLSKKIKVDENVLFSHGLAALVEQMPFRLRFKESEVWNDFETQVNRWSSSWRYDPGNPSKKKVDSFLKAVNKVYNWLEANS